MADYKCEHCDYVARTNWNVKMHYYSAHSTKEERQQQKYYCAVCDNVFFCSAYYKKHISGKKHANQVRTNKIYNNNVDKSKNNTLSTQGEFIGVVG